MLSDKQITLITLLADGQFHSGTLLAKHLNVSRSAIAKQLKQLSDTLALNIIAVTGKGYCLEQALALLNQTQIVDRLTTETQALLQRLEIHTQIPSTNRYLMELSRQQNVSGWVYLAEQQTQGKGRRGRTWVSPFGHNIYLSVAWQFHTGAATLAGLSLAVGVAVVRALAEQGVKDIGLKWPNDIYAQGKKLGGILIEVSGETDGTCNAVIGVGLNLFLPKEQAENITQAWTDLSTLLGQRVLFRNELVSSLLNHLLPMIAEFTEQGIGQYLDAWRSYDCLYGQTATLFIGEQTMTGIVRGVNDNGLLLLEHNGKIQAFASGEVSFSGRL